MPSRYGNRKLKITAGEMYREQLEERDLRELRHYNSPNMTYPEVSHMKNIRPIPHVWKQGDRYYKLAHLHYGDKRLWWVIAWFNKAPTESHLVTGQSIRIPTPLDAALSYLRDLPY